MKQINDEESTDGICDYCGEKIAVCECEGIHCKTCEDGLPRKHKCVKAPTHCEYCDEPIDDCNCQLKG